MNTTINIRMLVAIFTGCLIIALIPAFFFCYVAILILFTKAFVVICLIDYIRKTTMRKISGLILAIMFLAGIVAAIVIYLAK